jgi:hypothetical protein
MRHVRGIGLPDRQMSAPLASVNRALQELSRYLPVAGHVPHVVLVNGEVFVCFRLPFDEAKKFHIIERHC